ncbi:lactate dehydrogenase [Coraliomargarita sinensis]|uniref:site-specific DNA-methyltransferase (adenine-specific) n=1 Tax=Coraliomargarita sinensis TaxID=2174842 RepID=A0A317ZIG2_9BACT|nr:DNA methyltransferase [Coraliomargarita sinensis]PXA04003.1 lactate dehydrogenase [Coraliomargarita sinensis]
MNAVEIEEAVSMLAEQPFEADAFPYAFLEAFGNKATTIKRLKSGATNKSDVGGVLQRGNIHIKTCDEGEVATTLDALRESPSTAKQKARFILATDGSDFQAEDLEGGDTIACDFSDFSNYFGFFLELAGISTVRQIKENAFDIKATSRLNRLYVELLKDNPEWGTEARRHEMNHFMARLIFCFFAEDTDIFNGSGLFTATVEQMSDRDSSNTHEIIAEIFRAMDTKIEDRAAGNFRPWANQFPLVNGGLFSGSLEAPRFSKIARSYLLHVGNLDWTKINPDIFGSMIQAVADDEERGALGMHYTSVPNILKVLNPLFLDDLRAKLEEAEDNSRKLLNLRNRIARIRVFDPACGSGNFLVIAYKEMRAIEAEINLRRGERERRTNIPLTNFRGIELRDFSAEVARLALIIAEYQCDVRYRGQKEALAEFLPLEKANWITCGNALRLDWLSICPPTGKGVKHRTEDFFETPLDQAEIDFKNEGGETYICGNPPYKGGTEQNSEQKSDMASVFSDVTSTWKSLDYISGWFYKFALYSRATDSACAFVSTNSICQGEQVARLWPLILNDILAINFAHTSFKWKNLAAHNAGVTVVIIGLSRDNSSSRKIYAIDSDGSPSCRVVDNINAYLIGQKNVTVKALSNPISEISEITIGSKPVDGGFLTLDVHEKDLIESSNKDSIRFIRPYYGSAEYIKGSSRYCIWVLDDDLEDARNIPLIEERFKLVEEFRSKSKKALTRSDASRPHRFQQVRQTGGETTLIIPAVSSERRPYLPIGLLPDGSILSNSAFGLYDAPLWHMSLVASKMHLVWVSTVCGQLETRIRYSNTLGWNTFPVPKLTESNKAELTQCSENILLARESHFPNNIADLYDPEKMPHDLRKAHERNDEVLERIYIGRRFKNDTERLEKLFELYTKMTGGKQ